jgi:hypothetical protein
VTKLCALAVGDPFDGIALYGPFGDTEVAASVGENSYKGETWWVLDLIHIEGYSVTSRIPLHPEVQELKNLDSWGSHAIHTREDWRYEVAAGDTGLGYWEWLSHQLEQNEHEPGGDQSSC